MTVKQALKIFEAQRSGHCSLFIVHLSFVIEEWRGSGNDK